MKIVDRRIVAFIEKHHVMTLATQGGDMPWCCNIFYAYMPQDNLFVYTSAASTRHVQEALANPLVGGSIVLETMTVGRLQGIQMQGRTFRAEGAQMRGAKNAYYKRFPFAALMATELWILQPLNMKFTDNTLGFGTKLIWGDDE